jgi:hypothetical protein
VSDLLGLIMAAAAATEDVHAIEPDIDYNAISLSIPAVDGMRGIGGQYERWFPERRLSLSGLAQLRQTATGDYGAFSVGIGGEARWYWRAHRDPWLSKLPNGSMVGWFLGARLEVALGATHDRVDDRWLGESLDIGTSGLIGYRIAPWRHVEITPSIGLGARRQIDLSGRLPSYNRGTGFAGLSVGWLF